MIQNQQSSQMGGPIDNQFDLLNLITKLGKRFYAPRFVRICSFFVC
jgi:hypothetical protein